MSIHMKVFNDWHDSRPNPCLIIMYNGRAVKRPCPTLLSSYISRPSAEYWSQGKEMYKLSIAVLLGCFVGKVLQNIHLTIFATLFICLLFGYHFTISNFFWNLFLIEMINIYFFSYKDSCWVTYRIMIIIGWFTHMASIMILYTQ